MTQTKPETGAAFDRPANRAPSGPGGAQSIATDGAARRPRPASAATGPSRAPGRVSGPLVRSRLEARRWRFAKRTFDVVGAVLLVIVTSPLLLAVSIAVWCTSSGPVLFRQVRLGRRGRRFRIYKFRTMVRDAEQVLGTDPDLYAAYRQSGFKLAVDDDPRVTTLGRWLRRTSLDELPQLFNVIAGSMSLVGPRPIVTEELSALFGDEQYRYLAMLPGITGAWQVRGRSTVVGQARRQLDLEYYDQWSFAGDLGILLKTVPTVLRCTGAH